jgi:hypothetical protein
MATVFHKGIGEGFRTVCGKSPMSQKGILFAAPGAAPTCQRCAAKLAKFAAAREARATVAPVTTVDQVIAEIAKTKLGLASLEERGNDRDDFADLSIWQVRQALELAFAAGRDFETKRQK